MPDPSQLPYLLRLLEDESEVIQGEIIKHLMAFGPGLREELRKLPPEELHVREETIEKVLHQYQGEWLRQQWRHWFDIQDDRAKLEKAFSLLAEFQNGLEYNQELKTLFDSLAKEYRSKHEKADILQLSQFLFQEKGFVGDADYGNLQNNNIVQTITQKKGSAIILSCIYILTGWRLGLTIGGCSVPGHFMASANYHGRKIFVDCANHGQVLKAVEVIRMNTAMGNVQEAIHEIPRARFAPLRRPRRHLRPTP